MQVGDTYGTVHWFPEYAESTELGAVGAGPSQIPDTSP
jgi:hypothetical protein